MVQLLMDKCANFEVTNKDGYTALNAASKWGWQRVVQLLVDKNANFEVT